LLDIAERSRLPFEAILEAADLLRENSLLELAPEAKGREEVPAKVAHKNVVPSS